MVINGFGAVVTFVVMIIFAMTKFRDGAWIIVLLVPMLVLHLLPHPPPLQAAGRPTIAGQYGAPPRMGRHRVIMPIGGVHRGSLTALAYARVTLGRRDRRVCRDRPR